MNFRGSATKDNGADINLTPLIDVVFLLLIFFMVSSTFQKDGRIPLQLPAVADTPVYANDASFELLIDQQGGYYIDKHKVIDKSALGLRTAILAFSPNKTDTNSVLIRADGKAPHQALITSLDVLGKLGYSQINIATTNEE